MGDVLKSIVGWPDFVPVKAFVSAKAARDIALMEELRRAMPNVEIVVTQRVPVK